jgi:hypothetical protein
MRKIVFMHIVFFALSSCGSMNNGKIKFHKVERTEQKQQQELVEEIKQEQIIHTKRPDLITNVASDPKELIENSFAESKEEQTPKKFMGLPIGYQSTKLVMERSRIVKRLEKELAPKNAEKIPDYSKTALVMGILSFIPVIGWIFSILAIVFGRLALRRIENGDGAHMSRKNARVGMALGISTLCVGIILVLIMIIILAPYY